MFFWMSFSTNNKRIHQGPNSQYPDFAEIVGPKSFGPFKIDCWCTAAANLVVINMGNRSVSRHLGVLIWHPGTSVVVVIFRKSNGSLGEVLQVWLVLAFSFSVPWPRPWFGWSVGNLFEIWVPGQHGGKQHSTWRYTNKINKEFCVFHQRMESKKKNDQLIQWASPN